MADPFISIVIPTYNRAGYIARTLATLLAQDYDAYEIIVVDDGSTDNTDTVVAAVGSSRVRYYKKQNAERGAARNYGGRLATGQYVNFFDSDDLAYPNHLREAAKAVTVLNAPEIFHLGYDIKDGEGNFQRNVNTLPSPVNSILINGNHLSCNGVFIRRDIFLDLPFSENRVLSASEDYALWLRMASRYTFHSVQVITSTVVNHDQRSVVTIKRDKFLERMQALQADVSQDAMFQKKYKGQWGTFCAYRDIYIALHLAMANYSKKESLVYLWNSFKLRPQVVFTRRFLAALKNTLL